MSIRQKLLEAYTAWLYANPRKMATYHLTAEEERQLQAAALSDDPTGTLGFAQDLRDKVARDGIRKWLTRIYGNRVVWDSPEFAVRQSDKTPYRYTDEDCCPAWGYGMTTIHSAARMAAANGNPSSLDPMSFCPWCGTPRAFEIISPEEPVRAFTHEPLSTDQVVGSKAEA